MAAEKRSRAEIYRRAGSRPIVVISHAAALFCRARSIARCGVKQRKRQPTAVVAMPNVGRRHFDNFSWEVQMTRIRSFFEADRIEKYGKPTSVKTAENRNEVLCGTCGEKFFVDDSQAAHFAEAMETTNENTFLCEGCQAEYEELSHRE